MLNNVSISKFRNDIFNYIDLATKSQKQVGVTRGNKIVGWFIPNTIEPTRGKDRVDIFLDDIEKLQKKYPIKGGKNLSQDIDQILYGKK